MGTMEEYQKVLELLEELKQRIIAHKIRFCDLGADLIGELIDASFEIGNQPEDKEAVKDLIRSYMENYKQIARIGDTQLAVLYLENIQCVIRAWMLLVRKQEEDLLARINEVQAGVLPVDVSEENVEKHITMDVREFFLQQNADINKIDYQRLDVVIKYLAIENYFGKNDYGFRLHAKLQKLRSGQSASMPENYELLSREAFAGLIESIDKNGFDKNTELVADSRLFLLDGAHRLAACLYFGVSEICVKVMKNEVNVLPFTLEYLKDGGFTEEEIRIIHTKCLELVARCKVNCSCILWPSVGKCFDEITAEIGSMCRLVSCQDYSYSEETFPRIVRAVYHIDDIAEWKIEKKIQAMQVCAEKKIRVLELEILAPYFRLKQLNNNTLSVIGERLKAIIRNNYQNRVENYIYDIIIHTGDNFKQNEYMKKLFEPAISLEAYLEEISDMKYALIKTETPYCPMDFPKSYAFSKDVDILCDKTDYDEMRQRTETFLCNNVNGFEIRVLEKENGVLYRIELNGFLMIQLDIGYSLEGMADNFVTELLENRESRGQYYIPCERDEICIRMYELVKNPHKQHHVQYLKKYSAFYDREYVEARLLCESAKLDEIERVKEA